MVLFDCQVYLPWVDKRDSSNRVTTLDHTPQYKREFLLNPHFITNLISHTKGSTFAYSDNIGDRRESPSQIICNKTVAQITTYADTTPATYAVTLPIYPNNNPDKTPVDTTILWETISYVDRYNPDPEHKCWVIYDKGSFKRVEVLCNLALEDVRDKTIGGKTTSSTFSSVETAFEDEDTETLKTTF